MSSIVFFDGQQRKSLLPLTYLRPISKCRVGIRTIEEKWLAELDIEFTYLTEPYLSGLYPFKRSYGEKIFINGACLPSLDLVLQIAALGKKEILTSKGHPIVFKTHGEEVLQLKDIDNVIQGYKQVEVPARVIEFPEDILDFAHEELLDDYQKMTEGQTSYLPDDSVRVRGSALFIGKNVKIFDAIINTTDGPVYIDDDSEVMEGAVIKGPVYIGKGSKVHVGAKIYADTIIGPECRVGGEVKRTTMFGYANKAHDGYLGDSVLSHWCNLGADTNNSNMKNTYGQVSLWNYNKNEFRKTNRHFLGMILGDHTMSAINTSFNTGTTTGVFANILKSNPGRIVPSFSWGSDQRYQVDKAIEVATKALRRRNLEMTEGYEQAIRHLSSIL